jgi:BolA protein
MSDPSNPTTPPVPFHASQRVDLIRQRLNSALSPLHLSIQDESAKHAGHAGAAGGGGHYRIAIVCSQFVAMSRVQRHRLVYNALADVLQRDIHALSIRAYTPEEFASL